MVTPVNGGNAGCCVLNIMISAALLISLNYYVSMGEEKQKSFILMAKDEEERLEMNIKKR